jgi:hypothetical protein
VIQLIKEVLTEVDFNKKLHNFIKDVSIRHNNYTLEERMKIDEISRLEEVNDNLITKYSLGEIIDSERLDNALLMNKAKIETTKEELNNLKGKNKVRNNTEFKLNQEVLREHLADIIRIIEDFESNFEESKILVDNIVEHVEISNIRSGKMAMKIRIDDVILSSLKGKGYINKDIKFNFPYKITK